MNDEQIYQLFDDVNEDIRMLCIDAVAAGCYLYGRGHTAAGKKLVRTAVVSAGLDAGLALVLLENPEKSFEALAMHAELRDLKTFFSGKAFGKA